MTGLNHIRVHRDLGEGFSDQMARTALLMILFEALVSNDEKEIRVREKEGIEDGSIYHPNRTAY